MDKQCVFLSFVNASGFAGACIVLVDKEEDQRLVSRSAIQEAWERECNPGGEAMIVLIPDNIRDLTEEKYLNRLLTRDEAEAWDNEIIAKTSH